MPRKKTSKMTTKDQPHYDFNRLQRSTTDKVLAGVCGGIANFFDVDTTLVRLIFVFLVVFGGSGVFLYFILWVVLPSDKSKPGITEENIKLNAEEIKDKANEFSQKFQVSSKKENSKKLFGFILLFLGFGFLFSNFGFFSFRWIGRLWPLILIFLAFAILTDGKSK